MAQCQTPFVVKDVKGGQNIPVPCGRCYECLSRRASAWSFRLMQQEKISNSAHFITLTYDTEHVPITQAGYMSLEKEHLQKFFKKLRKRAETLADGLPIKYYACGEYGTKKLRPHYHIILFNADVSHISTSWDKGEVYFGNVTGASIGYTLKYMNKAKRIPMHAKDDRVPEFSLMSKGLGKNYLTPEMKKWHENDLLNRTYLTTSDHKKITMPRYYKDKLYSEADRETIAQHGAKTSYERYEEAIKKAGSFEEYEKNRLLNIQGNQEKLNRSQLKRNKL